MRRMILAICFLCITSVPAAALENEDEFPAPAIYSSTPLQVESLAISVSEAKVRFSYVIFNPTGRAIQSAFAFPIPPYEWTGTHRDVYKNGYRSLAVSIDGKKVELEKYIQAAVNGKDIANELAVLRINPLFEGVMAFSKEYRDIIKANPKLIEQGYLEEFCEADCENPENFYFVPRWTAAATYSFTHEFPGKERVRLGYEYEPIWGYSTGTFADSASWETIRAGAFLGDAKKALAADSNDFVLVKWLTLPVTSFGSRSWPENVTVSAEIGDGKAGFVYAAIGSRTAHGESSATIQIKGQPAGGLLKILFIQKP